MTAREDAIEAGARALMEIDPISWTRARVNAAAVVDAADPIIRADEREWIAQECERTGNHHGAAIARGDTPTHTP